VTNYGFAWHKADNLKRLRGWIPAVSVIIKPDKLYYNSQWNPHHRGVLFLRSPAQSCLRFRSLAQPANLDNRGPAKSSSILSGSTLSEIKRSILLPPLHMEQSALMWECL